MTKRILMLHGFAQNANIFSKRLGAIRKECGKNIEFVFVDGALTLEPADIGPTYLASYNAVEEYSSNPDPALTPKAWWNMNHERTRAAGLEQSLELLKGVLTGKKFDGVFGFSQGAAMAALLAALLERPHLYPPFLIDGEAPHPPFEFCVSVSGFLNSDPRALKIFSSSYSTPTLHVVGRTDIIVTEERSRKLIEISDNARVEEHSGGHFVPSKANWRKFFSAYLNEPLGNVPSPGSFSSSAGNSGTSTPVEGFAGIRTAVAMKL